MTREMEDAVENIKQRFLSREVEEITYKLCEFSGVDIESIEKLEKQNEDLNTEIRELEEESEAQEETIESLQEKLSTASNRIIELEKQLERTEKSTNEYLC